MSTYYVNINSTVATGDGTQLTPFNYKQLVNFFNPTIEIDGEVVVTSASSGDVIKVAGAKTTDYATSPNTIKMFVSFHESLSGAFTIEGWDVVNNGSPILYYDDSWFSLFDRGDDYLTSAIDSTLDITLKNFIVDVYDTSTNYTLAVTDYEWASPSRKISYDFKTVAFKSGTFTQSYSDESDVVTSGYSNVALYGCTLDVETIQSFSKIDTFEMYDCILKQDNLDLDLQSYSTLKANNNLTTIENYTSYVGSPGNVVDYIEPTYNTGLLGYSVEANSNNQITYYQTKSLLEYQNFNISDGGATDAFRTANDYATGLFGETRVSYGAYVFELSNSEFLTGHIGAFYFGGDFENVEITVDPGVIEFQPLSCAGVETSGDGVGVISLVVPEIRVFAFDSFAFDFSGTPVDGASPLYVKYHVYNYEPRGKYAGVWEAYEFRWWFDYGTSGGANDYIAYTEDRVNWLYCGILRSKV